MTLLGKIFVGMIFVLSLVFCTLAISVTATHRNWREAVIGADGLEAKVKKLERQVDQMQAERDATRTALNLEQAARRTALAALQSRASDYEAQLLAARARVEELQGEHSKLVNTDNQRVEELARLSADNANLRGQILLERQERDELFGKATEANDMLNRYRGEYDNLSERNAQLLAQLTQYQEVIDKLGSTPTIRWMVHHRTSMGKSLWFANHRMKWKSLWDMTKESVKDISSK